MVPLRHAINTALRRTTGYQLSRSTPVDDQPGRVEVAESLADAARRLGYRVHRLNTEVILAAQKAKASKASKRSLAVDAVDDSTWVLQHGRGSRRELVKIGNDAMRMHLLVDSDAARNEMASVQRLMGEYLAHEQVAWVLRKYRINCVLDVGANVGQYATRLRQHGYHGRIVSFEPVPSVAAKLRENAQGDKDWLVFDCGLGDDEGTMEINAVEGTMSSMLSPSEFGKSWSPKLSNMHKETISIARLDSLFGQATDGIESPRVYMKLDTQGYDLQAFRGAGAAVDQILALQSEVACVPIYDGMARLPEILAVYEGAGYEIAGMYPVTIHRRTLRVIEFDMIMVRPDASQGEQPARTET